MSSMVGATGASKTLKGTGYDVVQAPRMSPEVMDMVRKLRGGVEPGALGGVNHLSRLAAGGDEEYWKQLEAPAMRQFEELQGQIASRFSGAGTGARKSSGFQNAQSGAAASLAEQLQSNRLGLQQSAIDKLLSMYEGLIDKDPYDQFLMEKKKKTPWWQSLSRIGLPVAGAIGGGVFGGPMGAAAGFQAGNAFGSSLFDEKPQEANFKGIGNLPTKWGE